MKTILKTTLFASVILLAASCDKEEDKKVVDGYKPIYANAEDYNAVTIKASEPLERPGRIYIYNDYLLVNDQAKGIHIYDNANHSNPQEMSFIAIPGNLDFSVRDNMLYADNIADMVIVDISNPALPVYKNKISNVFPKQQFPDEFGAFECVNPELGVVVGWEKTKLTDPKCFK
jgi:hypothetical protein